MLLQFPYKTEHDNRDAESDQWFEDNWPQSYNVACPLLSICARCGIEYKHDHDVACEAERIFKYVSLQLFEKHKKISRHLDDAIDDGDFFVFKMEKHFEPPIDLNSICKNCTTDIIPMLFKYRDICEVDLSVTYLERAISCRKSFLKHKVKSKQQANLERCLLMPQRVFSMETWTWNEQMPSIS